MLAVTNVLVYAAHADSQFHALPRLAGAPAGATRCLVHHLVDTLRVSGGDHALEGDATAVECLELPHLDGNRSTMRIRLFSCASTGSGEFAPGTPISISFRS